MESMDMESILLDINFSGEEPLNRSSVLGDQMDYGTFDHLSDASLPNEFCKDSGLFLLDETPRNSQTNGEDSMTFMNNPLSDLPLSLDSHFPFDEKHYFPSSLADDYGGLFDEQGFTNLFYCGNLMKSPLSSEDVESILDTASLSDGDTGLSPSLPESPLSVVNEDHPISISPPHTEDFFVSLTSPTLKEITVSSSPSLSEIITPSDCSLRYEEIPASTSPSLHEEIPASTSPSLYEENPSFPPIYSIYTNESDGAQAPDFVLEVPLDCPVNATIDDSPCLLVSSAGKEKKPKSYRTKNTPYDAWDKSTESVPSPIIDIVDIPAHLSKKEKKKLQNKNAATRYRQKMKEEADVRKHEEDGLLKENKQLRNRVEEIQKEIQYLKNLLQEIGKVGTKSS